MCRKVLQSYGLNSGVLECFDGLKDNVVRAGMIESDPAALINLAYDSSGEGGDGDGE